MTAAGKDERGRPGWCRGAAGRPLVNRDYARLWAGQAVSATGDSAFAVTLVLWVGEVLAAGRAWAPAAVSGILVADGAAFALAGPLAGILADRWDRRLVMMRTEAVRAVLAAALAALTFVPAGDLPAGAWLAVVYATVFALACAGQLFTPAMIAATGDVVRGEADRARAAGLAGAATSAAKIAGPLAAVPLFAAGPHWALAADAASYVVSLLSVRSMHWRPRHPSRPVAGDGAWRSLVTEFGAGIRVFRGNRYLSVLLSVTMLCQVGTGALTLNLFFVTSDLHAPARLLGFAEMAMAGGFLAGSLAAGPLVRRFGARTLTWTGLVATGVLSASYALQRDFAAGAVVFACYGAMIGLLNTATEPLLLAAAPQEYMGRVMAVYRSANQITSAAAIMVWGWLASTVLRGVAGSVLGVRFNAASLVFVIAGALIVFSGLRALAALPRAPAPAAVPVRKQHRRPAGRAVPGPPEPGLPRPCPSSPAG